MITSIDWEIDAFARLSTALNLAIQDESSRLGRPELRERIREVAVLSRLLRDSPEKLNYDVGHEWLLEYLDDRHLRDFIFGGSEEITLSAAEICSRAERALRLSPPRRGGGKLYPSGATALTGPSPRQWCALMSSTVFWFRSGETRWGGEANENVREYCAQLWLTAGGKQDPKRRKLSENDFWAAHLKSAVAFRPPHAAGETVRRIIILS